jgi:hypothetical protein
MTGNLSSECQVLKQDRAPRSWTETSLSRRDGTELTVQYGEIRGRWAKLLRKKRGMPESRLN